MIEKHLLKLLQKKRGFFQAILELAEIESDLSLHDWISTMEQKKILLSCIDEVDAELHPFKAALHTVSKEIHQELENLKNLVKKILLLDEINQEKRKETL